MKDIHDQTYYELLEVEPSATQEEILKAYNRARATYAHNSPALYSLFNKEEAQELLRLIDEAYSVLSNQFKRKQYDEKTTGKTHFRDPPPLPDVEEHAYVIPGANSLGAPRKSKFNRGVPTQSLTQEKKPATPPPQPKKPKVVTPNMTPFGQYTLDPAFEEEIKKTEEFNGPFLQKIRLYKKVSLDQISEAIKVSRPYLMAIEENAFASLPAAVFVRGFLVQIAKILNLDPNKVANSYMKQLKELQKK